MLTHLNHLSQFTLFLIEPRVLFLLFSQLRCGIEQELEVLRVTPILKQVDLG